MLAVNILLGSCDLEAVNAENVTLLVIVVEVKTAAMVFICRLYSLLGRSRRSVNFLIGVWSCHRRAAEAGGGDILDLTR